MFSTTKPIELSPPLWAYLRVRTYSQKEHFKWGLIRSRRGGAYSRIYCKDIFSIFLLKFNQCKIRFNNAFFIFYLFRIRDEICSEGKNRLVVYALRKRENGGKTVEHVCLVIGDSIISNLKRYGKIWNQFFQGWLNFGLPYIYFIC